MSSAFAFSSLAQPEQENRTSNSASMYEAPASGAQQLLRAVVPQHAGILGVYSCGGMRRAILDSGPTLSGEVHFPFLLLKMLTFTDLAYIYQGPLWAEEISLKIVVPISGWQFTILQTPDLQPGTLTESRSDLGMSSSGSTPILG